MVTEGRTEFQYISDFRMEGSKKLEDRTCCEDFYKKITSAAHNLYRLMERILQFVQLL